MLHCAPAGLPESSSNNHSPAHHKTTLTKLLNCRHRSRATTWSLFQPFFMAWITFRKCPFEPSPPTTRTTLQESWDHCAKPSHTYLRRKHFGTALRTLRRRLARAFSRSWPTWSSSSEGRDVHSRCSKEYHTHDTQLHSTLLQGRLDRAERVAPRSWEGVRRQNDWLNL